MTATILESDVETDQFTEFEVDKPSICDWQNGAGTKNCDKTAEWRVVFSCCSNTMLRCQKHLDSIFDILNSQSFVQCARCGAFFGVPIKLLGSVTRL